MTRLRGIRQEHCHLAVLHPPCGCRSPGAAPGTGRALLDIASLIHHKHRIRAAQLIDDVTTQVIADRIGVPPGRIDMSRHTP